MSQHTARDIRELLARDPERVARHLLGDAGKREGHELRYGSTDGEAGQSLGIHLTGQKAGVWKDFDGGDGGDLLDLWMHARSVELGAALMEARTFLGLRDVPLSVGRQAIAKPIARPEGIRSLGPAAIHWLQRERWLSPEAIAAYRLAQQHDAIAMPYLLPDGTLAGMKFRAFPDDKYWAAAGMSKVLFGWQAIPENARSVVLCEGELKALAFWDYGYPALSVPFGGGAKGKQDWIEVEYDRLDRFDTIYLAMDADAPGKEASDEIMRRLGPERCALVNLPLPAEPNAKCINACLRASVSRSAIEQSMLAAKPRDPAELHSAGDYADQLAALLEQRGPEVGIRTPWQKVGDQLLFRPGELTVIAGYNGSGKSQAVGFMAAHAMREGSKVCVASLEFKVPPWLKRLVHQVTALSNVTPAYGRRIVEWLSDKLWAFDAQGTADWRRMLEVFRYARRRYGVDLFVVDNLTGLGIGEEDYQGQKEVTLALSNFARDEDCHVWLVHHIRKSRSESEQPDKMDIKGSGAITDLASTVLTVWRNKPKEEKAAEAASRGTPLDEASAQAADVRIVCSKQRNYYGEKSGEPRIALWWAAGCFHYLAKLEHRPLAFVTLGGEPSPADVSRTRA